MRRLGCIRGWRKERREHKLCDLARDEAYVWCNCCEGESRSRDKDRGLLVKFISVVMLTGG